MMRLIVLALIAAALVAQTPKPTPKPPAKTDKALRARVTEFYQDFVSGRFRDAQEFVAKDTLDYFFSIKKEKYVNFKIQGITYSPDFKNAQVNTLCDRMVMMPGFAGQPIKMPVASNWKLEKGKWYWYVPQEAGHITPFGKMGGSSPAGAAPETGVAPGPRTPPAIPTSPDFTFHKIKADKESLALKAGESGEVTFTNSAQGPMTVSLAGKQPGIEVAPETAEMKAGGAAKLTIKRLQDGEPVVLNFSVSPTGEIIPVKVNTR